MEQHPDISVFCSTSVNPIRICTYKSVKDDTVHILDGAVLRIGYEGETNDGTHGNGKFVGINRDGTLMHKALDFYGNESETFNGIDFRQNHRVPNYDLACNLAESVAKKVLHHRLLAFDIMIDKTGKPIMLEFNIEAFSMWLAQFVGERAFGDFTDEILEYTRNNLDSVEHIMYW